MLTALMKQTADMMRKVRSTALLGILVFASTCNAAQPKSALGASFDDVDNGTGDTLRGNQTATSLLIDFPGFAYPEGLVPGTRYYWRIDEGEADGVATHKGDIWSFTTMPADASWAATYYVDGGKRGASDNNPGTEARPWKTIGRGTQSLQPGDTLLIRAGTYRETVILRRSGTEAEPIRIRAYPGDEGKVIINAAEPVTNWRRARGARTPAPLS